MSVVLLRVVCTFPELEVEFKVASDATVGQVKSEASKYVKADTSLYNWSYVSFGEDVVNLDTKALDAKVGWKNKGVVFCLAPASLLPPRRKTTFKEKGAEQEQVEDEKFKGLTKDNIYQKLAKAEGKKKKLYWEYFDINTSEILKTKRTEKLPKEALLAIVKRESITAPEIEVFEACLAWAKAQLKEKSAEATPEAMREVLGEIFFQIRFPLFETEEIATKVAPSGILEQAQVLDLFTYLAQKDTGAKPGKSLAVFPDKPRSGGGRYGSKGAKIPAASWTISAIRSDWSYGSWDNVNASDRYAGDLPGVTNILNGTSISSYLRGDTYEFPRGGSVRCGIYTYPNSNHVLEIKFTKGTFNAGAFRFFTTRLESGVRMRIFAKKPGKSAFETDDLASGFTLPMLGNGSGLRQWVNIPFPKPPVLMEELRVEVTGGQCAFHALEFVVG